MAAFERCIECLIIRDEALENWAEIGLSDAELENETPMAMCSEHTKLQVTIEQMVDIKPHPNAHSLDVAMVGQHRVVTGRHYVDGQWGYYIPEGAVVPNLLAEEMELLGLLDGPDRNIVKARKMRGILSEGLFYGFGLEGTLDAIPPYEAGQNMTDRLGVTFVAI
jgi:RNA ligase (TIGR02306 family)